VPLAFLTAYNVIRQEVDTNLPPFVGIFANWHWAIWLNILLAAIIIDLILQIRGKSEVAPNQVLPLVGKQSSGRDSIASGRDTIIHPPATVTPPNIFVGAFLDDQYLVEKMTLNLRPLPAKPDVEKIIDEKRADALRNSKELISRSKNLLDPFHGFIHQMSKSEYQTKVNEYLAKYIAYEAEKYNVAVVLDRYCILSIVVENQSTSPASQVFIELHFPEEVHFPSPDIISLSNKVSYLKNYDGGKNGYQPTPPKEPTPFDSLENLWTELMYGIQPDATQAEINTIGEYKITSRNGLSIVTYEIRDLIQNRMYTELRPIRLWFDNIEKSTVFHIPVKIYAREVPKTTERRLEIELIVE